MLRGWLFFALAAGAAGLGGEADLARVAERLGVPSARVPRLAKAPDSDSSGRFPGWAGPLAFAPLDGSTNKAPPAKTSGYLACDAQRLYAAIRCEEPDMSAVPSKLVPKDGDMWAADSVEFLLLPGLDPAGVYYHFAVNPAGSLYDAKANDKAWDSGATVLAFKDATSWTVVLAVPYATLGVKPGEGSTLWRVNLHRLRPRRGGAAELDVAWSPTLSRSNHVPSRFGLALVEGMGAFDPAAAMAFLEQAERLQVLLRQTFDEDATPFNSGKLVEGDGPNGAKRFLRVEGKRQTTLGRNFGDIRGLQMACAYRTSPDQVGLVIHGNGTIVRACRPGKVEVLGRGLKVAQTTCRDADGASRAFDLGFDAYRFLRPYGH